MQRGSEGVRAFVQKGSWTRRAKLLNKTQENADEDPSLILVDIDFNINQHTGKKTATSYKCTKWQRDEITSNLYFPSHLMF